MMDVARVLLLVTCLHGAWAALQGPQVTVLQGTLRGTYLTSANGNTFAAFQGIPYAKPPVGKQRFKEPVPAKPWRGVWNAAYLGSACLQFSHERTISGDEDCLYLNVYAPIQSSPPTKQLDVIVNIHGGAFMHGSSQANGPKYLLDRDVVLVTMNYRLGPLGFFSTGDDVIPGNNGLKDQVLALRWVQQNVAAFGGNPNKVTLTGTSAGGASVHLHYISPLSKGLFHQGISLSGTALVPWAQTEGLKQRGELLAELLGCPTYSVRDMVDCLRHRPARLIVEQLSHLRVWLGLPFTPFGPTIEVPRPEAFLSEQPIDVLVEGRAQNLPWITGVTSAEGLYPAADFLMCPELTQEFRERWEELAPVMLEFNATVAPGQRQAVIQRIKKFYFGDKEISQDTKAQIIQMIGDRLFVADAQLTAQLQAKHNSAPVYFYQFSYRGKHSLSEVLSHTDENMGSSHGDDTAYVFDAYYSVTDETEADRAMSRLLVDIWINFVHSGNPSPSNISWPPLQPGRSELNYLHLGSSTSVEMRTAADLGNRHFWDTLPIREPQINYAQTSRVADEL